MELRNSLKIASYCFTLVLHAEETNAAADAGKGAGVTSPVRPHAQFRRYLYSCCFKAPKGRGRGKKAAATDASPWHDEGEKEKNLAALVGVLELDLGALWTLEMPEDEFSQVPFREYRAWSPCCNPSSYLDEFPLSYPPLIPSHSSSQSLRC